MSDKMKLQNELVHCLLQSLGSEDHNSVFTLNVLNLDHKIKLVDTYF